jgi:ATP phosphoribosyltransferase
MLKLVLPKGSLERLTFELFDAADLPVRRESAREYRGAIDDPRVESVAVIRPQEIPRYIEDGHFDLGITGQDWVAETESDVVEVATLSYAKATPRPVRIVLAVAADAPISTPDDLPPELRVSTEYVGLTQRYFDRKQLPVRIVRSYGSNEAKVPGIVDAIVHNVETGDTLVRNGLKIVDTLMESWTVLIANRKTMEDDAKRKAVEELRILLDGAIRAQGRVLVKLNVPANRLDVVLKVLPSMKAPTVAKLATGEFFAVETVVAKSDINTLIPELKARGAEDIIELPLSKIVP